MLDIDLGLKSIGASIGVAKAVAEAKTEYDLADLRLKMADVMNTLADAKVALTEAQGELRSKDGEIKRLLENFARRDETVEYGGKLYRQTQDGKPKSRPFCPPCATKGTLFLLDHASRHRFHLKCELCKSDFPNVTAFSENPAAGT